MSSNNLNKEYSQAFKVLVGLLFTAALGWAGWMTTRVTTLEVSQHEITHNMRILNKKLDLILDQFGLKYDGVEPSTSSQSPQSGDR